MNTDEPKEVGERTKVNANEALGTEECWATIREVTHFGYIVHIDGDDPEWEGPIDRDGDIVDCRGGNVTSLNDLK